MFKFGSPATDILYNMFEVRVMHAESFSKHGVISGSEIIFNEI